FLPLLLKSSIVDAVIFKAYSTIYLGISFSSLPAPCPLNLFLAVGTPLSNKVFKDVNLLSQNAGISCFSKHILIKVLAVAVLLTVHFCLSQIIRIVLSNALRHS